MHVSTSYQHFWEATTAAYGNDSCQSCFTLGLHFVVMKSFLPTTIQTRYTHNEEKVLWQAKSGI